MSSQPTASRQPVAPPEVALRLGMILAGLAALIARRFLRMPHLVGLIVPLWSRLSRAARRFERLMTRPARVRAPRPPRPGYVHPRSVVLPGGRGWLVRELGYEAAAYMSQLQALLAEPEMQAALAAYPGAGRVLRPLCQMLGVTVAPVAAPVVIAKAAPVAAYWPPGGELGLRGVPGDLVPVATIG